MGKVLDMLELLPYSKRQEYRGFNGFHSTNSLWNTGHNSIQRVGRLMDALGDMGEGSRDDFIMFYLNNVRDEEVTVANIKEWVRAVRTWDDTIPVDVAVSWWVSRVLDDTYQGYVDEMMVSERIQRILDEAYGLKFKVLKSSSSFDLDYTIDLLVVMDGEVSEWASKGVREGVEPGFIVAGIQVKKRKYFSSTIGAAVKTREITNARKISNFFKDSEYVDSTGHVVSVPYYYAIIEEFNEGVVDGLDLLVRYEDSLKYKVGNKTWRKLRDENINNY